MKIIKNTNILQESKNIIQDNFFMSQKRKDIFIKTFIYSWTITEDNTTIYFFLQDNSISKYKPCIRKILTWIQYMRYYFHNTKPLTLWIYSSEYTKKIPPNNIITCDDINSGSTTTYIHNSNNGVICIWRKEEIYKVLLHELIHAFRIDNQFPEPIEAYTEYHALILNIFFELFYRNIDIQNATKYIEIEKQFSLEQCKKVLQCKNDNTNIIHYIIDKTQLLYNCSKEELMHMIKHTNTTNSYDLRFTITDIVLDNTI